MARATTAETSDLIDKLQGLILEGEPNTACLGFARQHIQRLGQHNQGVAWQKCRQEGGRWVRKLRVADFKAGVEQLVLMGFGEVIQDSPLTYKATREMP